MQGEAGFRERRLSAKLHDSVLVISSSTEMDFSILSVMVDLLDLCMYKRIKGDVMGGRVMVIGEVVR